LDASSSSLIELHPRFIKYVVLNFPTLPIVDEENLSGPDQAPAPV
jgi:hypothetical protein